MFTTFILAAAERLPNNCDHLNQEEWDHSAMRLLQMQLLKAELRACLHTFSLVFSIKSPYNDEKETTNSKETQYISSSYNGLDQAGCPCCCTAGTTSPGPSNVCQSGERATMRLHDTQLVQEALP